MQTHKLPVDGKWVILIYRPGSGGKFLCSCLLTIDRIAHWDQRVEQGDKSWNQWVDELWKDTDNWFDTEPLHSWDMKFFSRQFPRNIQMTTNEFKEKLELNSSDYLKQIYYSDKLILDFYHQEQIPEWWSDSYFLRLDADLSKTIYKKMLLSKNYKWDESSKLGIICADKPHVSTKFTNQWKFGPFKNQDHWFDYITTTDSRLNFKISKPDITLDQLIDFDCLKQFIEKVSNDLESTFNEENLKALHSKWTSQNSKLLIENNQNSLHSSK